MHPDPKTISLSAVPFPRVDFQVENPIPAITQSLQYRQAADMLSSFPFGTDPLISWGGLALLHSIIRNQHPDQIVEIGSYKGSTARVLATALEANGSGVLHTIGPFDSHHFLPNFERWPNEVKVRTAFHPICSMDFFIKAEQNNWQFDLVFIDGNHDYEYALFDLLSAARRMKPSGFIVLDNVSQAGPYYAARDFLKQNPLWNCCDTSKGCQNPHLAFDTQRRGIPDADFCILRAPEFRAVGPRPHTFGQLNWHSERVAGIKLLLSGVEEAGMLWVQCVLRGFSQAAMAEAVKTESALVNPGSEELVIVFEPPLAISQGFARYSVEPWFTWTGGKPLKISEVPQCL